MSVVQTAGPVSASIEEALVLRLRANISATDNATMSAADNG